MASNERKSKVSARILSQGATLLAALGLVQAQADVASSQGIIDTDRDGIYDIFDNCVDVRNGPTDSSNQIDSDLDGHGNICDPDFDQSGTVTMIDFGIFMQSFGKPAPAVDLDGAGSVTVADFALFMARFGGVPAASGLLCADPLIQVAQGDRSCQVSQQELVVPGRYIVVLHDADEESDEPIDRRDVNVIANELLQPYAAQVRRTYDTVLRGFSVELEPEQARELLMHPAVAYVDPVVRIQASGTQTLGTSGWPLDRIDDRAPTLDGTYTYGSTGRGVHVYVIDSGIRISHDEFEGRAQNDIDFVGDGAWHCHDHGTHVASIVGGRTYGVAKKATLHNVRILDCSKSGFDDDLVAALDWVAENHVSPAVANVSIGWEDPVVIHSVTDAVKGLVDSGVTTVVAAGNEDDDACRYPMSKVDRVLAVGAVDSSDTRSTWTNTIVFPPPVGTVTITTRSNWGACVDLFAPGSDVVAAINTSDSAFDDKNGTSMAAPHVAGAAALYLSRHPQAHPTEVASQIVGHATGGRLADIGTGSPDLLLMTRLGDQLGDVVASGDLDGDGGQEVVIGAPGLDDAGTFDSGGISIVRAGGTGPFAFFSDEIAQSTAGVWGDEEDGDGFGGALAIEDFNGDGFDDVAVSMVGDSINGNDSAGAVNVFFGSSSGFSTDGENRLHQDLTTILGDADAADWFGAALAAGDFNGDGFADLAVGVPGEDDDGDEHSGIVNVVYGTSEGLNGMSQLWAQSDGSISGTSEPGDLFGASLAVGDFDCDQYDDLAIGSPGESIDSDENAGRVVVLYGNSSGLRAAGSQSWHQDSSDSSGGITGSAEKGDFFGAALTAGDFNGSGCADLAVGSPGEDLDSDEWDTGMASVIYGSTSGLTTLGETAIHQDTTLSSTDIAGAAEDRDLFGVALTSGDFDGNGRMDLAVGSSGEAIDGKTHSGMVSVIYGTGSGLTGSGNQAVHQDSSSIAESSEIRDRFGDSLASGDLDGDGRDELIVGVPGEDISSNRDDEGLVQTFYGGSGGLTTIDWTY